MSGFNKKISTTSTWTCPPLRSIAWFVAPVVIFFFIDAAYATLVIWGLQTKYHPSETPQPTGFGELWVLMPAIIFWIWCYGKHQIRRDRFERVMAIMTDFHSCYSAFLQALSNDTASFGTLIKAKFNKTEANITFLELITTIVTSICLSAQLLLWELITNGGNPDEFSVTLVNSAGNAMISQIFQNQKSIQAGQLNCYIMVEISEATVSKYFDKKNIQLELNAAKKKMMQLVANYHRTFNVAIDWAFMVFMIIYLIGMPFILWISQGYYGIGTNSIAYIFVTIPFSYNWFIDDIFERPSWAYTSFIYKDVMLLHRKFKTIYQFNDNLLDHNLQLYFRNLNTDST